MIPETIKAQARAILFAVENLITYDNRVDAVANAILAERQRCADVSHREVVERLDSVWWRDETADAVRDAILA